MTTRTGRLVALQRLALDFIVPAALVVAAITASLAASAHGGGYGGGGYVVVRPQPLYLHVPPHHARHWHHYCHRWHACGHHVIFVRPPWLPRLEFGHVHRHGYDHGYHRWHHRPGHHHRGYGHRPPPRYWAYR